MKHPHIPLTPVTKSTNVDGHGYDATTKTLAVQFKSGLYHYSGVPADLAHKLTQAKSVGSFIATEIRPRFKGVRVDAPPGR